MDNDLSSPWTLSNMAMALNLGMLSVPPVHSTTEMDKAILIRQSYIHDTPTEMQAVFIPATNNENHPVPAIVEEHKLYFKPTYNFLHVYTGPMNI